MLYANGFGATFERDLRRDGNPYDQRTSRLSVTHTLRLGPQLGVCKSAKCFFYTKLATVVYSRMHKHALRSIENVWLVPISGLTVYKVG